MEDSLTSSMRFLLNSLGILIPPGTFASIRVLITTLTILFGTIDNTRDLLINENPLVGDPPEVFDFIIVGAGSAGSVLCNRLSANGGFKVLLLEAGGNPTALNGIPNLYESNLRFPETSWVYSGVAQVNSSFAVVDRSSPWVTGKSLGGSSSINDMTSIRGNPKDFDDWARLTQDKQWSYDNLLPYFRKLENYQGNFPPDPIYHGTDGPTPVTPLPFHPLQEEWLAAGKELDFSVTDPSARQTSSFFPFDVHAVNGIRQEGYTGYIKPALERRNLKIIRYARVTKININSENRATGVNYIRGGRKFTALASKEVIVSGGYVESPKLLMLSGIGPKEHLLSVGITPKVHLPGVGQNLMSHVSIVTGPFILNETASYLPERDFNKAAVEQYLRNRTGPVSFSFTSSGALISTLGNHSWPNIAMFLLPSGISAGLAQNIENSRRVIPGLFEKYLNGFVGRDAVLVQVNLAKPKSLGSITLQSNDPFDDPLIDPNFFSEISDVKALVAALRFTVNLFEKTKAFQKYNATLIPNHFPGCESFPLRTDAYYECYIRQLTLGTNGHFSSSCKMGRVEDKMTVVDSHLKVKFCRGLRVVDGSIFPSIPNGNFHAPVTMIGEKASELILQTWMG